VCGGQRQNDRVFGRGCLQLEVESAAEALAQRQSPRAIDAAAERRVDDQLHAAGFIEEALEHDRLMRRQAAEGRVRRREIRDDLRSRCLGNTDVLYEPGEHRPGAVLQSLFDLGAQP
jgi:hypothetical protein